MGGGLGLAALIYKFLPESRAFSLEVHLSLVESNRLFRHCLWKLGCFSFLESQDDTGEIWGWESVGLNEDLMR